MSVPPSSLAAQLPRPGDIVGGKYVIDSLIGQGGMGAVFRGKHRVTGGVRAIKVMLADASNPEARQRFMNEARAAAEIQNEHVVRVDDVDEELGYAFMVLELLDGEDLAQILEREKRPLAPHVAVDYVLQALRGVAQAHALGIVHRDLKPSNLFLARRSDGSAVIKVLDFGISKASSSSPLNQSPSSLTSTKAMLGSPLYMSPEQLRSSKSVDARADIWACGVILFELVTGTLPFMGESLGELFAAILETDPPTPSSRAPSVSPGLDAVVMRCLQRRPEHRYQNAAELIAALMPFAQPGAAAAASPYAMSAYAGPGATAAMPPGFNATPNPGMRPMPPHPGAVTGGGSGPRPMPGGTVALGGPGVPGGPPMLGAQTNSSWQTSEPVVPKKSPLPVLLAFFGSIAVASLVLVLVFVFKKKPEPVTSETPPVAASSVAPVVAPTQTATPAVATAVATASAAPVASATTPAAVTTTVARPSPKPTHTSVAKTDPPKPVPSPPAPKPTATSTSGIVMTR